MTEPKHAPGTWAYCPEDKVIFVDDGEFRPAIAWMNHNFGPERQHATGRIMAASKAMFDFIASISRFTPPGKDPEDDALTLRGVISHAKHLVRQAEGSNA